MLSAIRSRRNTAALGLPLTTLACRFAGTAASSGLRPRQQAPPFSLPAVVGKDIIPSLSLSSYLGKWVVLISYPLDHVRRRRLVKPKPWSRRHHRHVIIIGSLDTPQHASLPRPIPADLRVPY